MDPDLATVIAAWPTLAATVRATMLWRNGQRGTVRCSWSLIGVDSPPHRSPDSLDT